MSTPPLVAPGRAASHRGRRLARAGRAEVVGTGLIGASLGLALRSRGWQVSGRDQNPEVAAQALAAGAVDRVGEDPEADLVVVATPLGATASVVQEVLDSRDRPDLVVTDVAGVKAGVVDQVEDPRFVGGHPMAGSEQLGVAGADPTLFEGCTWVLTPTARTDPAAFARVRAVVTSLGAEVVALEPARHDALVAVVSHVPHLTAATLMNLAAEQAEEQAALLRLAAGGFRDMTRVAAGEPTIWPDVCLANRAAIVATLDQLLDALGRLREQVAEGQRAELLATLQRAALARRALPVRGRPPRALAEIRVPVPDRPGVLAEITTLAGGLGLNVLDVEIAHSAEGSRGVLVLVIDATGVDQLVGALRAAGYRPSWQELL